MGLFGLLAVISASTLVQAGQAELPSWKTAVKIACDGTVAEGVATKFELCSAGCVDAFPVDNLACGTNYGMRSNGRRVDTGFKPVVFRFTLKLGVETCTMEGLILDNRIWEVGSTVLCNDARSLKLSVGRPH
jgi:hypothetical protein